MLKANENLIPGVDFVIGGETYTAAPLTLGGIRAVLPKLGGAYADAFSAVLTLALRRNYPEATQPWLDETMTGREMKDARVAFTELMEISGLTTGTASPGEPQAAA